MHGGWTQGSWRRKLWIIQFVGQWRLGISTISQQRFEIKVTLHKTFIPKLDIKRWKSDPLFSPTVHCEWAQVSSACTRYSAGWAWRARPCCTSAGVSWAPPGLAGRERSRPATQPGTACTRTTTTGQCHSVTVSQCHKVTGSQGHSVLVSKSHRFTVSQSHSVTVSKCQRVKVSQCHRVSLSQSLSVAVSQFTPITSTVIAPVSLTLVWGARPCMLLCSSRWSPRQSWLSSSSTWGPGRARSVRTRHQRSTSYRPPTPTSPPSGGATLSSCQTFWGCPQLTLSMWWCTLQCEIEQFVFCFISQS